jgi:hypothetical protein
MTTRAARRRTGRAESAFEGFSALAATFRSAILSAGIRWLALTSTALGDGRSSRGSQNRNEVAAVRENKANIVNEWLRAE